MTTEEIIAAAIALEPKTRAEVVRQLIVSLDEGEEGVSEAECEAAWVEEVDRRIGEQQKGNVEDISVEVVFARARALLRS